MNIKSFFLVSIVSLFPFFSLSALELRSPKEPSVVEVPSVPAPSADLDSLKAEYYEIYSALKVYSNVAYSARQDSPVFLEVSASGQYLRGRLEAVGMLIERKTGFSREVLDSGLTRKNGEISRGVLAELSSVFGFSRGNEPHSMEMRGVPIKLGYCQINYVKNSVPFLVQYDGFLKKGEVILTFDDGPGQLTEEVSSAMKDAGASSVFFVLGSKLGPNGKELVKRTALDGHSVAVHGYNHATGSGKPFTALSTEETLDQLGGVSASIAAAVGRKPVFFRPPYGIISPEALKAIDIKLGLVPVGWTIDTLDWSTKDPEELFLKTTSLIKQRGKGIVLMHDIHSQSRTAAKRLVKWLAENGYKVVSPERMTAAYKGE